MLRADLEQLLHQRVIAALRRQIDSGGNDSVANAALEAALRDFVDFLNEKLLWPWNEPDSDKDPGKRTGNLKGN